MKKLALIDLDGTLFDTAQVNYYAYNSILNELGYNIDYEYFVKNCNGRYYEDFLLEIASFEEKELLYIHDEKKERYKQYVEKARKNEHLFSLLRLIKEEYYLAIVTTASRQNVDDILSYFQEYEMFDLIITQNDIKKKKPDPEGFIYAMNYFGKKSDETIVFEDSPQGIEAANAIGATVFVIEKF